LQDTPTSATKGDEHWRIAGVCLVLAAMTFAVFGQTLWHQFVNFDDNDYVYENPVVERGLTAKGLVWAFTQSHASNWHPLTWLSHELDCQFYGLRPGGHHLTSVLLHTATVILLFLVLRVMTGSLCRSTFVAALFAIHPLRVESVAWVAERKDVLSGLFFMLTIGAYVRYVKEFKVQSSKFKVFYGLCVVLFVFGLMSKPMLVTLPMVLLLLDYWPLQRAETAGRLVMEKIPLLAFSAVACVVTLWAQRETIEPLTFYSLPLRLGNALCSCMVYLGQMVYPAGLAAFYPYPLNGLSRWEVVLAALLLAGFFTAAMRQRRRQPWLLVGWLWYLVMLLPVVGVLQTGDQAHADRYTYLPQIGIYVAATWLMAECAAKWHVGRAAIGGLMTAVLGVLMICAWKQTAYWNDSETLWTHALGCTKENAVAHVNLSVVLLKQGRLDEAMTHCQIALQINPNFAEAHNNLGLLLVRKGRYDEAITQYHIALGIEPQDAGMRFNLGTALAKSGKLDEAVTQYQIALRIRPDNADGHNNLATAFGQMGKLDEEIGQYQIALQINPNDAKGRLTLGSLLLQKGRVDEAINQFQKSLQIKPDDANVQVNLGGAYLQEGKMDEAIVHYQRALQISPNYAEVHNNLGLLLLNSGKMEEASAHFQKAVQLAPNNPQVLKTVAWVLSTSPAASLRDGGKAVQLAQRANDLVGGGNPDFLRTLAAAFAEAGRFNEAKSCAQKAIGLARSVGRQDWAQELNQDLNRYQAGLPLHQ
jgi:protein O-mannosyl-transferase